MAKKLFNGRMLYVCVKGSRTIIGVFGSSLESAARDFIAQKPGERMLWARKGLVQHLGEELKRGATPVPSDPCDADKAFVDGAVKKATIYEALRAKLGREPTHAEQVAEVKRILAEGARERAGRGRDK